MEQAFYVDNCLDSVPSAAEAKQLVSDMREILASGGFEIRQWAGNVPSVVSDLPQEARSDNHDLWMTFGEGKAVEPTLGLHWNCETDQLMYRYRPIDHNLITMRINTILLPPNMTRWAIWPLSLPELKL